jgi:hypothetical protein
MSKSLELEPNSRRAPLLKRYLSQLKSAAPQDK